MKNEKRMNSAVRREAVAGYLFIMPFIIGFLAFSAIPILISLYLSFTEYDVLGSPKFIGLQNYIRMFTADPKVWKTFGVTFFYAAVSVPLKLIMALAVAMLFLKNTRFTGFMRGVYYLPSIMGGSIAVAVLWRRLFASDGVINALMALVGLPGDIAWLGRKDTAIWTLIILAVWQFGSSMLIFLSALKQIPVSLYEAARVDGANGWQQFWKITLKLLTPTIHFNLVMQMINGFLAFTQCLIITQGKPMNSTLFYTVYMYQQSFLFGSTGYGAALAWIMLALIAFITWILFATKKLWVYDGGL